LGIATVHSHPRVDKWCTISLPGIGYIVVNDHFLGGVMGGTHLGSNAAAVRVALAALNHDILGS
jgi:hypothetical protein